MAAERGSASGSAAREASPGVLTLGSSVSELLGRWRRSLGSEGLSSRARVWNRMRGSMVIVGATLIECAMVTVAIGMAARSLGSQGLVSSLVDMVYLVSMVGCGAAQHFFATRGRRAQRLLLGLERVARELEATLPARDQVALVEAARSGRKWFKGMRVYAYVAAGSVVLPHVATLRPVPTVWPPVPDGAAGAALNALLAACFGGAGVFFCLGYSDFLSLHLVAAISSGGLYGALAAWLHNASGEDRELRAITRLHGEVNALATELEELFATYLLLYLLPPLGGTALATCGFLFGTFTTNYMSLVPQIFIVFMPICLYGDAVSTSSGVGMCWGAYSSGWLEWQTAPRRTLAVLMARSARPQAVSVKAFGQADREACLSVLKTWFSFLQALTNLSN